MPFVHRQALCVRGLSGVKYQPIYSPNGRWSKADPNAIVDLGSVDWQDPSAEVAHQVCLRMCS